MTRRRRSLRLGQEQRVRLVMPKLGAPVEPSRVEAVVPWWQSVRSREAAREAPQGGQCPLQPR